MERKDDGRSRGTRFEGVLMMREKEYQDYLDELGARWGSDDRGRWVESFGDTAGEYDAVVEGGTGIIDRSERETVVISGEDAIPWLQGLVTNDLFELADEGSGQRSCAVNQNGRLIADMRLLHVPELLIIDLEAGSGETLLPHLRRHIIMEKVNVVDRSPQTGRIGVYGEGAQKVLESAGEFVHPIEARRGYDGTWGTIADEDVIVAHRPWLGIQGYEIFCDRGHLLKIWRALEAVDSSVRPFGDEVFEMLRIEAGIPRYGVELNEKIIPLEANLSETISFEKGCYLGQEIIARLDTLGTPARRLRRLIIDGNTLPEQGAKLLVEGKNVGALERAIESPRFGQLMALGFVKRKYNEVGTILELEGGGSVRVEALRVSEG